MQNVIDVSKWNGRVDWGEVKKAGHHAVLRCGYGANVASQDDSLFKRNADECERLGIAYGVYLYSYAKTAAQARDEAAHALRLVKGRRLSYPIYFDSEERGTERAARACAVAFGGEIEKAGHWCGVYASESWWKNNLKGLERYTKWVAKWGGSKPSISGCDMWQHTESGKVRGIVGNVDMSRCYRDFPSLIRGKTYVVRKGDTLGAIAKRYNTTWEALAKRNGLVDPNRIYPGQRIKI